VTDREKTKAGKAEYTGARTAAQSISKDPVVKAPHGTGDAKVVPHNRDVTTSIRQERLKCPPVRETNPVCRIPGPV